MVLFIHMNQHEAGRSMSREQITDRLEQLEDIIAVFQNNEQGKKAQAERDRLKQELKEREHPVVEQKEARPHVGSSESSVSLSSQERAQQERMEQVHQELRGVLSTLLAQAGTMPDLYRVIEKLKDIEHLRAFYEDRSGVSFFTSGMRDQQAIRVAQLELQRLYERVNHRGYESTRRAA